MTAEALSSPTAYAQRSASCAPWRGAPAGSAADCPTTAEPGAGLAHRAHRNPPVGPPTWPDPTRRKQAHIELGVDDLDAGQDRMPALGAVAAPFPPRPDVWRVLLDPAGHPICLSTRGV
ncbi:VOC family protein [Streptomyces sp. NPDC001492]